MRIHPARPNWQTLSLIGVVFLCAATSASAVPTRLIRFDEGNSFATGGTMWDTVTTILNPTDPVTVDPIDLSTFPLWNDINQATDPGNGLTLPNTGAGFSVDYGAPSPFSSLRIYADGFISFGDTQLSTGIDAGNLVDNVAAPFYVSGPSVTKISYAKGFIIPDFVAGDTVSVDDAVNAFRVTWFLPSVDQFGGEADYAFQVVLLDRSALGAGDFDMEFNYQDIQGGLPPPDAFLTAGFQLGTNVPAVIGPYTAEGAQTFQFRGGILQTPTTSVPEPNSLPLFLTGLMMLVAGAYRGRKRRQPAR